MNEPKDLIVKTRMRLPSVVFIPTSEGVSGPLHSVNVEPMPASPWTRPSVPSRVLLPTRLVNDDVDCLLHVHLLLCVSLLLLLLLTLI